jgi:carbamoyltransferase|tara:strand:- start:482 stop:2299 length:1818 start_codon:yes stop_codon:yes gene_type:complete
MNILGISAFYHDSAACLVRDGDIIAAAQEERFTRKKHDFGFPLQAINYCLREGGITSRDIDHVVFYDKPFVKFERILLTHFSYSPFGFSAFLKSMPLWLKQKLWLRDLIKKELDYDGKILFTEHHESHAASCFYPSPFQEAAFITTDGVGEWTTTSYGVGSGNNIKILAEIKFPHSLGLLYSAFTYYTGFRVNFGEYKLMGLAPYGEPRYVDLIYDEMIKVKNDGSFRLNMKYFDYCVGLTMTNKHFHKLLGAPPRKPESKMTRHYMDAARSAQVVTEEILMKMARHVHNVTNQKNLCLAGGVALNCVANGRILREGPFEAIWIQPAAGDAGGALGAALQVWYDYLSNERQVNKNKDSQKNSCLGPSYSDEGIESFLQTHKIPYRKLSYNEIPETVSELIINGQVIGWFQGRAEFGPRALGSRSIIGDARAPEMQSKMNLKIKYRESFRPFAPTILREKVADYFEMNCESPYMLLVAPVKPAKRRNMTAEEKKLFGIDKLNIVRSDVPAITHVDYSARVQTIGRKDNPLYYGMLEAFYKKTGCPLIINTSFNVRGEPIVGSPEDAYKCFMRTEMDYLVMGSFLLAKKEQVPFQRDSDWMQEFEPD